MTVKDDATPSTQPTPGGHTAESWRAKFEGYSEGWTVYGDDYAGEFIIAQNIGSYADDAADEARAEREARLIASAPDLLAFAQAYDEEMTSQWPSGPDGHPATLDGADRDLWVSARSAIAKATGQ